MQYIYGEIPFEDWKIPYCIDGENLIWIHFPTYVAACGGKHEHANSYKKTQLLHDDTIRFTSIAQPFDKQCPHIHLDDLNKLHFRILKHRQGHTQVASVVTKFFSEKVEGETMLDKANPVEDGVINDENVPIEEYTKDEEREAQLTGDGSGIPAGVLPSDLLKRAQPAGPIEQLQVIVQNQQRSIEEMQHKLAQIEEYLAAKAHESIETVDLFSIATKRRCKISIDPL